MQRFWNKILRALPSVVFFRKILQKALSLFVSLKVHILTVTTVLLVVDKISETTWATVTMSIALGRIVVQGIAINKNKFSPISSHEEEKQETSSDDIVVD